MPATRPSTLAATGAAAIRSRAEHALRLAAADPAAATRQAGAALRDALRAGDLVAAAEAERALGMAARTRHDMVGSAAHLGRAVRLATRVGASQLAARARVSRALALAYCGRFTAAFDELAQAADTLRGAELGRVELQRAAVLQLQGRLDDADEHYTLAFPLLSRAGEQELLAALLNNRGQLRSRRGALSAAESDLRQAVALHRDMGQAASAAETIQNLGLIAARRGDLMAALAAFDEADHYLADQDRVDPIGLVDRSEALLTARLLVEARDTVQRALREQERRKLSAYVAEARLVLARIALHEGNLSEAQDLAARGARAFARQKRSSYRALAEEVRIHAAWLAGGRTARLLAASQRAAAALEANGWGVAAADARLIAAQVALALGRTATARAELAGLTTPRRGDPAELRSRAFHARALLHLADGDRRRTEAALRAGIRVIDRYRRALGGTELRTHASAHAADLAGLGLRLAAQDGDPARVLTWAERWRAGALALRPMHPPEDRELADALAELRAVADLEAQGRAQRQRQAALERKVQRLARRGGAGDMYQPPPASAADVQALLGDHALLELVDIGGTLHAVLLTSRHRVLRPLTSTLDLARSVVLVRLWLRRLVYHWGSADALTHAERALAAATAELDETLLRPLARWLDGRPVVVVPTARLHALPWALLPSFAGRPVVVAPSASWWRRSAEANATVRPAAPVPPGTGGRTVLVSGPDLESAGAEAVDLLELYPRATHLGGSGAAAEAVAHSLDGADVAHIAAHGTFRADQPLLSSLRMADGPLTVYDLERLRRAPRLLVLACCDAGLSDTLPGDELMGLAACVLAQGTATLVAPIMPVRDKETHEVMLAFHRRLAAGATPATALAATIAGVPDGAQRYCAASFACLGTG